MCVSEGRVGSKRVGGPGGEVRLSGAGVGNCGEEEEKFDLKALCRDCEELKEMLRNLHTAPGGWRALGGFLRGGVIKPKSDSITLGNGVEVGRDQLRDDFKRQSKR